MMMESDSDVYLYLGYMFFNLEVNNYECQNILIYITILLYLPGILKVVSNLMALSGRMR